MELALPDAGGVAWSVTVHDLGRMPLSPPSAPASPDVAGVTGAEGFPGGIGATDRPVSGGLDPDKLRVIASLGPERVLRTASVGKVLLLVETARGLASGELDADEPLTRLVDEWVGDSGLWHTLSIETLPLIDVAALVGATSDNLATNVLLRRVGLDAVAKRATLLGLRATALHDRVRDVRTSTHAETLSTGSAAELGDLAARLAAGRAVSAEADRMVRQWLSANVDQSMVSSAFVEHGWVDPIAHHVSLEHDLSLWNKTGTDAGVRADVGAVTRDGHTIAWAAIANWEPAGRDELIVWSVLRGMRHVGEQILDAL
jgi:beta-lactamase class A